MAEIEYRFLPGYPMYRIGNDGSVWSKSDKMLSRHGDWGKLKPGKTSYWGHLHVCLSDGGQKRKWFHVHQLVLLAFVGPCPEGMQGCHDDGNPANNAVGNLRWDTPAANGKDATRHASHWKNGRHHASKLTADQIRSIRDEFARGVSMGKLATRFGVCKVSVFKIVHKKSYNHPVFNAMNGL